jgi:hypothetical protein
MYLSTSVRLRHGGASGVQEIRVLVRYLTARILVTAVFGVEQMTLPN